MKALLTLQNNANFEEHVEHVHTPLPNNWLCDDHDIHMPQMIMTSTKHATVQHLQWVSTLPSQSLTFLGQLIMFT